MTCIGGIKQAEGGVFFCFAPEIDAIARGSFKEKGPPGVCSGYVVHTAEPLSSRHVTSGGPLMVVNLGDADTTGAVYGSSQVPSTLCWRPEDNSLLRNVAWGDPPKTKALLSQHEILERS